MKFPFYKGDGSNSKNLDPVVLPKSKFDDLRNPENYLADKGLVDACNVALILGQPLLLTGEPGTGKTLFAYSLAMELGYSKPLKFETKSNSNSKDLFYTYDTLKHFQDSQAGISSKPVDYISYHALGKAILNTKQRDEVKEYVSDGFDYSKVGQRSVVLIDEIDKAPRDFPNDVLNEMELMYFRVRELGNVKIEADQDFKPIVVITSNSEKDLPDAFLRRCIYYNIPFPKRERLATIVSGRLGETDEEDNEFLRDALDLFYELRAVNAGLRKKPATAELLNWMASLKEIVEDSENPLDNPELVFGSLSALIKTGNDQQKAVEVVNQWIANRNR